MSVNYFIVMVVLELLSFFWFQKKWNVTVLLNISGFLTQNKREVFWSDWVLEETGKSLIFVVPFTSGSHSLPLKLSLKVCSELWILHSNDDFFHSNPFFEWTKLSFDNFLMTSLEQENKRKKEAEILRHSDLKCINLK